MIKIKNLRVEKPKNPWDAKVDRSSILGNPYKEGIDGDRDEVCDKHSLYFAKNCKGKLKKELDHLIEIHKKYGKLNLFCWCTPKRCHSEPIKAYLEEEIAKCQK